jgi:hypothetical protein
MSKHLFRRSKPASVAKRRSVTHILLLIVFVLVLGSQLERFVTHGTVFGYQLRRVGHTTVSSTIVSQSASSGIAATSGVHNQACQKVTKQDVASVLGGQVAAGQGMVSDRTTPYLLSNCAYTATASSVTQTVAIVYRQYASDQAAKQVYSALAQRDANSPVHGVGQQAFFVSTTNQLTALDHQKLVVITITGKAKSTATLQAQATRLATISLQ